MNIRHLNRSIPLATTLFLAALVMTGCSKQKNLAVNDPTVDTPAGSTGNGSDALDPTDGSSSGASLRDVFFAYDDHSISAEARSLLSANAADLREKSPGAVTIEGHCDERGTVEYNLALGQRRAEAVQAYLVDLGIDAAAMNTISYGEERPFDDGEGEEAWSQNRRAHFRLASR